MIKYFSVLFSTLLLLSVLAPIECGRFGGRSGGSSRGGSHSYPSSHGLSGSGSRGGLSGGHGYPSSSGGHAHPSSSGNHAYPSSGGLSGSGGSHGYPSSGGSHGYPSSGGSHGYPSSGGSSGGSHSYPSSNGGLSGSGSHGTSKSTHTTINNHYHYSPPQQISYAAPGHRPVSYPVYHGTPPSYVYQYKDSGSKYGSLLAGLALLNLGTLAGAAYLGSRSHSNNYKPQPGEVCKFAVKKSNGDYEETKIDCQLITSFIFEEQAKASSGGHGVNSTVVTTSVTNVTTVNMTNADSANTTTAAPTTLYQMLPNGTLVPVNITVPNTNTSVVPSQQPSVVVPSLTPNGTGSSTMTVTTTTTNTTVVNALDVKGKEIEVTPGMECFVIRHTPTQNMRKHVSCGLLQSYATQSLKRNSGVRNMPTLSIMFAIAALVMY